jgi:hypothetical protein
VALAGARRLRGCGQFAATGRRDSPAQISYPKPRVNKEGPRQMAEHKHGSMDITEQEKTFDGFIRWSVRVAAVSIGILIFLAIFNS